MNSNDFSDDMMPAVRTIPTVPDTAHFTQDIVGTPETPTSSVPNPIGLEHFDEIITSYVEAAKKAGAKGIRLNCLLSGDIMF